MKQPFCVFSLFSSDFIAKKIQQNLDAELGEIIFHQFPDEEIMVSINSTVKEREVIFVASLDRPNAKLFPLIAAAETARALGAKKITLVAPYLPYMRQDKSFHPGEGITSQYFAKLISCYFDELITIDPHLHRWHSLNDIYTIPAKTLHATDHIAHWIKQNVTNPVLIGPDMESKQWVAEIAKKINVAFLVLEKIRKEDRDVHVSFPTMQSYQQHTPVLVDDIISTAATMIQTVKHLKSLHTKPPVCIGVHAIFADNAYEELVNAGAETIITCNTILHHSNKIDISDLITAIISRDGKLETISF